MKKLLCFVTVLLFAGAVSAQTTDTTNTQDTSGMRMMHDSMVQNSGQGMPGMNDMHGMSGKMKDCIMMMDGKAMVMRGGQHTVLNHQMTFANGTAVMPDGTVKMANGTTHMLKNGECVYMNGTIGKMGSMGGKNSMSDSTMQMGKDSARM
jgi:hypothetical protein